MHVGMSVIFQNPGEAIPDWQVYQQDLALARLAEPLGFQSIWSVEHHFTDYTMCPDVYQFLSYMAGCTETIQLGSMVCVLPWHDPVRVAEEIAMLDITSGGRVIIGIGRGTGRIEFEGFGVAMPEARSRFAESADMILNGLEQGWVAYDGEYLKQPRKGSATAPDQIVPREEPMPPPSQPSRQPSWPRWVSVFSSFPRNRGRRFEMSWPRIGPPSGKPPARNRHLPYVAGWTFVDPSADRAEEMAQALHRRLLGFGDQTL